METGPLEKISIMLDGKVTEAMGRMDMNKENLSKFLGLGPEALKRKGTAKTLGTLSFITIVTLAHAAGYTIEFKPKDIYG